MNSAPALLPIFPGFSVANRHWFRIATLSGVLAFGLAACDGRVPASRGDVQLGAQN